MERQSEFVQLNFQSLNNVTSPDEKQLGVKTFILNIPCFEILKLDTRANLRSYLAEYNPRKRNRVHEAIRNTIDTEPHRFIVRNSGFVVCAAGMKVRDEDKVVTLTDPSIINGSQSQGEIRRYLADITDPENGDVPPESPFFVRVQLIVDPDPSEIVETAIARNVATPVKSLSEAGARNQLDDLERSIQELFPDKKIRKSESQTGDEYLDTRQVLQLARLLMPTEVSGNASASEKLRAYKNPEQCLTDFSRWYDERKENDESRLKYDFTVSIAPYAIREYQHWESHKAWTGHKIWSETKKGGRSVRRDVKTGVVTWVSPGLVFPIMGALSEFVKKRRDGSWVLEKPKQFHDDKLVFNAVQQYRAHNSDPMLMGRAEAAYDALRIYPRTLVEVLKTNTRELA